MMNQANFDMGTKSLSLETALLKQAVRTSKETGTSLIDCVMDVNSVTKANKDKTDTVIKSTSSSTDKALHPASNAVFELP